MASSTSPRSSAGCTAARRHDTSKAGPRSTSRRAGKARWTRRSRRVKKSCRCAGRSASRLRRNAQTSPRRTPQGLDGRDSEHWIGGLVPHGRGTAVTGLPGLSEETVAAMTAAALREAAALLTEAGWTTGSIDIQVAGTGPASLPPALGEHFDATSRRVLVALDDSGPRLAWFRHQLAHALLRERHPRAPPWVDEGFARSMEAPSGFLPMHLLARVRRAPDPDGWYRDALAFSFAALDPGGLRTLACHALFASLGVPGWSEGRTEPAAATLAHWERRGWRTDDTDLVRLQQLAGWLAANPDHAVLRARLRGPRLELYEIVELAD